jgi:hypothetical protein
MRAGRLYRVIRLYNWLIGISCGLTALGAVFLGSHLPAALHSPEVVFGAFSLLEHYIQDLVVANLVVVGACIVRGPWAAEVLQVLRELAQRHTRAGAKSVEPSYVQGARLTWAVVLVAPAIVLTVLLAAEHPSRRFVEFGVSVSLTLICIVVFGAATGMAAVYIRRTVRKHPIVAWFGLWIAPELVRALVPVAPTPRSVIGDVLAAASFKGGHID